MDWEVFGDQLRHQAPAEQQPDEEMEAQEDPVPQYEPPTFQWAQKERLRMHLQVLQRLVRMIVQQEELKLAIEETMAELELELLE